MGGRFLAGQFLSFLSRTFPGHPMAISRTCPVVVTPRGLTSHPGAPLPLPQERPETKRDAARNILAEALPACPASPVRQHPGGQRAGAGGQAVESC